MRHHVNRLRLACVTFILWTAVADAAEPWRWFSGELRALQRQTEALSGLLEQLPPVPKLQTHEHAGFHSGLAQSADAVRWVQVDLGREMELEAVVIVAAMLGADEAYAFPPRFRVDASRDALFADATMLLEPGSADTALSFLPWYVKVKGVRARYVRFTATQLGPQPRLDSRFIFCLGELMVFSGGRNVALGCPVESPTAVSTPPTWMPRHLVDGSHALGLPVLPDAALGSGWHSAISGSPEDMKWVEVDWGEKRPVEEIRLIPAHPRDYPDRPGFGFPKRFRIEADGVQAFDATGDDWPNPGDTLFALPTPGLEAKSLRITATRLWERSNDFVFALAEVQAFSEGKNLAQGAAVTYSDVTQSGSWSPERLVDGRSSTGQLVSEDEWFAGLSKRRELGQQLSGLEERAQAATEVAKERASWVMAVLLSLLIAGASVAIWRGRLARDREVRELRDRISRDLHDEIGSHLGGIRLMSELAISDGSSLEAMEEINRLAGEAAESMRGIIWLVREGGRPKVTRLVEAMRQSAAALLKGAKWSLQATESGDEAEASLEFHRHVFLLYREALHNITRHAHAKDVRIEVTWGARRFRLGIEDDGNGFDVDQVPAGCGLTNLRHRAGMLGGSLNIRSEPGKGTSITLEAPLS